MRQTLSGHTSPIVDEIWSLDNYIRTMILVEQVACGVKGEYYRDNKYAACAQSLSKIQIDDDILDEIQRENESCGHIVVAIVNVLKSKLGDVSSGLHTNMTSSDVTDTAMSILIGRTIGHMYGQYHTIKTLMEDLIVRNTSNMCCGRTHGRHAEHTTVGLRAANWWYHISLSIMDLLDSDLYCKLSGPVGTYSGIDHHDGSRIEELFAHALNLKLHKINGQSINRTYLCKVAVNCALVASNIEKMATDVRILCVDEVGEACFTKSPSYVGSSSMPHKKNPVECEKMCGVAHAIRGMVLPIMDGITSWFERDLSSVSTEKILIPQTLSMTSQLLDYTIHMLTSLKFDYGAVHMNKSDEDLYSHRMRDIPNTTSINLWKQTQDETLINNAHFITSRVLENTPP